MVHLRPGETLRRYLKPGLQDGKTFVFWGMNYNAGGIPGPQRDRTWVNQPDAMYKSKAGTPYKPGQARFANAVYTYRPDFAAADYKEGVVSEDDSQVTFEFQTPFVIGATPPNTYALTLRESLFHGVQAIRLTPVSEANMFDRDGILAHTYMLGPSGQSNGCVSFRDYQKFLRAYQRGEINRIVVVPKLASPPASFARGNARSANAL